jgi:putative transposase
MCQKFLWDRLQSARDFSPARGLRVLLIGKHYRIVQLTYRRLPHLYVIGEPLFITFRLRNSLPHGREFSADLYSGKAFVCMDRLLDRERAGPTYLRMPAIANAVIACIRKGMPHDYLLHAWVVMPNHLHLLLTPHIEPAVMLRKLKGASAREANKLLGLTGQPFWQDESYDRLVRSQQEFERIEEYILQNPVRAGLARSAEEYPWSSICEASGLKPAAG